MLTTSLEISQYYKNTLSAKKLVLSSYHEKGLGYWARISSALVTAS